MRQGRAWALPDPNVVGLEYALFGRVCLQHATLVQIRAIRDLGESPICDRAPRIVDLAANFDPHEPTRSCAPWAVFSLFYGAAILSLAVGRRPMQSLNQAFAAFDGVRAVIRSAHACCSPRSIVDVSSNTGGSDAFALHIASRFADRRRLAFTKIAVGA